MAGVGAFVGYAVHVLSALEATCRAAVATSGPAIGRWGSASRVLAL